MVGLHVDINDFAAPSEFVVDPHILFQEREVIIEHSVLFVFCVEATHQIANLQICEFWQLQHCLFQYVCLAAIE